jgi:hypothetical protein
MADGGPRASARGHDGAQPGGADKKAPDDLPTGAMTSHKPTLVVINHHSARKRADLAALSLIRLVNFSCCLANT